MNKVSEYPELTLQEIKSRITEHPYVAKAEVQVDGVGRVDIKMDEQGTPYFLEANLIPGLGIGYFYRCYNLNTGLNYEQMILDIVGNSRSI